LAGRRPIEHVARRAAGHSVNRGGRIACALDAARAVTRVAATVLQTQIEYVTVPPGAVLELCCTIWAVMQIAPAGWW
jgi:hypothetical protein